jgi:cytochrome c2
LPPSTRSFPPLRKPALVGLAGLAAALAAGCGAVGRVTSGDAATGKTLFVSKCGSCHVLQAAGTTGKIGPSLDDVFGNDKQQGFKQQTIRDVVRGQIAYAEQPMPTNLVRGRQADDVSVFVARCAGDPSCDVTAASS